MTIVEKDTREIIHLNEGEKFTDEVKNKMKKNEVIVLFPLGKEGCPICKNPLEQNNRSEYSQHAICNHCNPPSE